MKLRVLWVGKSREAWVKEAVADYGGRIRRYLPLELCEVRDEKGALAEEMRRRECERLEKQVPPGATLVLMDERGDQLDSPAWPVLSANSAMRRSVTWCSPLAVPTAFQRNSADGEGCFHFPG